MANNTWTENEIRELKKLYGRFTANEISNIINRSRAAILIRANQLGLTANHVNLTRQYYQQNKKQYKKYNTFCIKCGIKFIPDHSKRRSCYKCVPYVKLKDMASRSLEERYSEYKTCTSCNKTLSIKKFAFRSGCQKRLLNGWCKNCGKLRNIIVQHSFKLDCMKYKGMKCFDCHKRFPACAMDFHHRDPRQKDFVISSQKAWQITDRIKKELDKCDLLCSNCHRIRHAEHMDITIPKYMINFIDRSRKQ